MNTIPRMAGCAGVLALAMATASAQSNHAPFNNGAEVYFTHSDPSVAGDLWWRAHPGNGFMNDVDPVLGSVMEIDGYRETLLDEDWSDSADFLDRTHGPAVRNPVSQGLEPAFLTAGFTTEVLVSIGPSGFASPCTLYPSLCVPPGSTCAPAGSAWGWVVEIVFGATPGTGVVLPAGGTAASDMATTYFLKPGMSTTGGACGGGTYETSDLHSIDETQGDVTGLGVNPSGGFQLGAGGPVQDGIASMAEGHESYRRNILNMVADSGTGLGVEVGAGGGAMNGRNLDVGSGLATLGVHLGDSPLAAGPHVGIVGASLTPLANPGVPLFGGWLGVMPDALFLATSSFWQGVVVSAMQIPVPASVAGVTLHVQGATFSLASFTADTTNVVTTGLVP